MSSNDVLRTVERKNNEKTKRTIKLCLCVYGCMSTAIRTPVQCPYSNNRAALIQRYCCCDFSLFAAIVVFGVVAVVAAVASVVANKSIEGLRSFCCLALETISRKFVLLHSLRIYSCPLPTLYIGINSNQNSLPDWFVSCARPSEKRRTTNQQYNYRFLWCDVFRVRYQTASRARTGITDPDDRKLDNYVIYTNQALLTHTHTHTTK